jgi:hypothetical protein
VIEVTQEMLAAKFGVIFSDAALRSVLATSTGPMSLGRRWLWKLIARPSQRAKPSTISDAVGTTRRRSPQLEPARAVARTASRSLSIRLPLPGRSKSGMDTIAPGVYDTGRSPTAA